MAIEETIAVGVTGLGEVTGLADALDKAATAAARLDEAAGKGFSFAGAAAGADKLAASYEAAFAKISAQADAMDKRMADLGKAGGDASAAGLASVGDAGKSAAAGMDSAAASASGLGAELKGAGAAGDSAAAGLARAGDAGKSATGGLDSAAASAGAAGDAIKGSAAQMAEFNAVLADSAKIQRDTAAVSADANAKIALGQRLSTTAAKDASAEAVASQRAQSASAKQAAADAEASSSKHSMVILGVAAALGYGVDKAAQLQTSVTRLYTTADESAKNLPVMTAGILALSGQTNTSQAQLGQGAYMVESAGYHGKDALGVLKAAAEGAQAEGAPLGDTANALTSLMNAYGIPKGQSASQAAMSGMDQIIAMVSRGKMTMAGAVGALPDVLPAASAAKLSFADVGGALSTMTSLGATPDRAAQNLSHVITSVMSPSAVQTKEQQQLGLNPVQIQNDLGKQGLTGTLEELSGAVMKNMGPAGDVLFKTFNQSKSAASDANTMISAMPPAIRGVAQAYADGKTTVAQWNQEMFKGSESAQQKNMLQQFATTENQAKGFNDLLKAGSPSVQTYAAAMDKLLGGQTGLNVAMELTGQHMPVMKANTDAIAASAEHAGSNVAGWSKVQQNLSFQLGATVKTAEAVATEAGQVALPAITDVLKVASAAGGFLADHPAVTKPLEIGGGVLAAGYALQKVSAPVTTALQGVGKIAETLHIPGLEKLSGIGSAAGKTAGVAGLDTAASGLSAAGGSLDGAAASLEGAAAALKETSALPGGKPGAPGEPVPGEPVPAGAAASEAESTGAEAATAGEEAAAGGFLSKFASKIPGDLIGKAAGRLLMGATVAYTGNQIADMLPRGAQQAKAPIRVASDMAGGAVTGSTFGPIGTAVGAGLGLWAGLGANTNLARFPNMYAEGAQKAGGGYNAAFGKTGPAGASPYGVGTETTARTPPPAAAPLPAPLPAESQMPHMYAAAGHPGTMTGGPPVKIPAPDLSAVEGASAKVKAALQNISQVSIKPAKVPAPDLSGLDAGKAKAMSAAQGITTAITGPLSKPVHAAAPDLAAFAAARGPAQADGAFISAGLASGIESEKGAVVAAAADVASAAASAMASALKTRSPSKVTEVTGEETTAGLAVGISSGAAKAKVKSAAITITEATVNSLVTGLQGGQSAIDAAMTALGQSTAKPADIASITATVAKLKTDLSAALKKGDVSKSEDSALTQMLNKDNTRLQQLAAQRDKLVTEIGDSQQIAQSAVSGASIMNAGAALPPEATPAQSSYQTIQGMQYQAQQAQQFTADVGKLKASGLNAQSLNQIVQSGAGSGDPVAQGILQGGKGAVSQLNQLQSQITAAAGRLGDEGAPVMFSSGQQLAAATGKGLKAQLSQVDNEMKTLAKGMTNAVKAAVGGAGTEAAMRAAGAAAGAGFAAGILSEQAAAASAAKALAQAAESAAKIHLQAKSPSRLFALIGGSVPEGFAQGVTGGTPLAESAVARMTQLAASRAGQHPAVAGAQPWSGGMSPYSGGQGQQQVHSHTWNVTVQGNVTAERELAGSLQGVFLEQATNNWRGGLRQPGRAV